MFFQRKTNINVYGNAVTDCVCTRVCVNKFRLLVIKSPSYNSCLWYSYLNTLLVNHFVGML